MSLSRRNQTLRRQTPDALIVPMIRGAYARYHQLRRRPMNMRTR